jgi:hypothetical protein
MSRASIAEVEMNERMSYGRTEPAECVVSIFAQTCSCLPPSWRSFRIVVPDTLRSSLPFVVWVGHLLLRLGTQFSDFLGGCQTDVCERNASD